MNRNIPWTERNILDRPHAGQEDASDDRFGYNSPARFMTRHGGSKEQAMPLYEYRCEGCGRQFEIVQAVSARAEDTSCPHCRATKATRLMSSFASKVVGDHKPGFKEMKAQGMLGERMHKFSKLPPLAGKRAAIQPNMTSEGGTSSSGKDGSA
jgi:putative FmdB family regulatory protein